MNNFKKALKGYYSLDSLHMHMLSFVCIGSMLFDITNLHKVMFFSIVTIGWEGTTILLMAVMYWWLNRR
jgi:hypothetical protein